MKHTFPALLAFALCSLFVSTQPVRAQGTAFTYQGFLTSGGAPANGAYDLSFTLFPAASGSITVGMSNVVSSVGVTNGLFTVTLDFGSTPFNGNDRWLEIGVRPAGGGAFGALTPRQRVTATPYAITAGNVTGSVAAGQLTGTIAAANIGAGSITTVMLASGAVGSNQLAAGAVTTGALADGAVSVEKLHTTTTYVSMKINNPAPGPFDYFGNAVAVVGTDKVLIGAHNNSDVTSQVGTAYLFSTNGTLLTTFLNPTPQSSDFFGDAVAAVGADKVLIGASQDDTGAPDTGAAYLFHTNGTLVATFNNPTPGNGDLFGFAVAALGSDKVIIGAQGENTGGVDAGGAYLFRTNGTLLMSFLNPTPLDFDNFGIAVAGVGTDKVLIGAEGDNTAAANAGAAYLFNTNGTLLTTFTRPAGATGGRFGQAVAAVGADKVLIGAPQGGTLGEGEAYLFTTNGTHVATFTNPTPASFEYFGSAVTAVGTDKVLIGAYLDDSDTPSGGAAYLFSTNGALLTTLQATPSGPRSFGNAVAALGANRFVIGAPQDDEGAFRSGAVYIMSAAPYLPGVVSERVVDGAITTSMLAEGSITDTVLSTNVVLLDRDEQSFSGTAQRFTGTVGVGTNGTLFHKILAGTAQMTNTSSTAKTNFTFAFPNAFNNPPRITVTARNEPAQFNADDTFAVSVRRVTTTNCTVNIVRVDAAVGWGQLLIINWIAWD